MTGRGTTTIFIHLLLLSGPLLPLPPLSLFYPLPSMCGCNSTGWNILSPLSPLPFLYSVSFSFSPVHRCRVQLNLSRIVVIIRYVVIILFLFIHFFPPPVSSHFFSRVPSCQSDSQIELKHIYLFFPCWNQRKEGKEKEGIIIVIECHCREWGGNIFWSDSIISSFLLFPPLSSSFLLFPLPPYWRLLTFV